MQSAVGDPQLEELWSGTKIPSLQGPQFPFLSSIGPLRSTPSHIWSSHTVDDPNSQGPRPFLLLSLLPQHWSAACQIKSSSPYTVSLVPRSLIQTYITVKPTPPRANKNLLMAWERAWRLTQLFFWASPLAKIRAGLGLTLLLPFLPLAKPNLQEQWGCQCEESPLGRMGHHIWPYLCAHYLFFHLMQQALSSSPSKMLPAEQAFPLSGFYPGGALDCISPRAPVLLFLVV